MLVVDVDAAPTMVICRPANVTLILAALFAGWTYKPTKRSQLGLFGSFAHPSGVKMPVYQFGIDFSKIVTPQDVLALEGDFVPQWAYPCLGVVTCTPRMNHLLISVHKYYDELEGVRTWIQYTKQIAE